MTKIYKFQDDISVDVLKKLEKHSSLAIDTEGSGLQIPHRDKLSLVQFSTGNNDAYIVQPNRKNYKAPNVVKILENNNITKIGHYLRYDVSGLQYFLNCEVRNIWCFIIFSIGLNNICIIVSCAELNQAQFISVWNL